MEAPVRIASPADAGAVARLYEPYVRETAISFDVTPPTPGEFAARIAATLTTHPFLVCVRGEEVVGYAYASRHRERAAYRWSADVAIYVAAHAHRSGVARALYGELLGLLTRQGFHTAFAGITLPNAESVGLHQAMGFTHCGTYPEVGFKQGAWRDVGWWRRPLSATTPPTEPIPFPALQSSA